MSVSCGLVGLPNAGKSTLFNAVTSSSVPAEAYPFCTVNPNVGVARVPDERLDHLSHLLSPESVVPAVLEFVDIAGLIEGSHRGEGLGNQFLNHIREVDLVVHVLRLFERGDVSHPSGRINPERDYRVVRSELKLKDVEVLTRRREKLDRLKKVGKGEVEKEMDLIENLLGRLEAGQPVTDLLAEPFVPPDLVVLSAKPELLVLNTEEEMRIPEDLKEWISERESSGVNVVVVPSRWEADLTELEEEEVAQFRKELGVSGIPLNDLLIAALKTLRMVTFFTAVHGMLQAWLLKRGSSMYDAAGLIHSDIQKGFIRAEVVRFEDLQIHGSEAACREKGAISMEGKDGTVSDGTLVRFRFRS